MCCAESEDLLPIYGVVGQGLGGGMLAAREWPPDVLHIHGRVLTAKR